MPFAVDPDSVAFQIGEWIPAGILTLVGLLLLLSGRSAGRESPGSGSSKRGWGIGLLVLAGIFLAARVTTVVKEAADDAPKSGTAFTSQSAEVIADMAIQQMQGLTALKIKVTTSNADGQTSFETTFDVEGRCRARFKEGALLETFIFDGNATYVRANRAGWRSLLGSEELAQDAVSVVGSKWAIVTLDDLTEGMAKEVRPDRFCDFDRLFESMKAYGAGGLTVGDTTVTGGVESIELLVNDGRSPGRLWIEAATPHHLLRLVVTKDGVTADTSFSDFNKPLPTFKPAKRDTVDLR